jgi:subtilisin family serine protease
MQFSTSLTIRLASVTLAGLTAFAGTARPAAASVRPEAEPSQPSTAASSKALLAKAEKNGEVPVIVELRVGESRPSLANLVKHAAETNAARGKLLKELGRDASSVADFGELPIVAISATPRELAILGKSGQVRSVHEDREIALDVPAQDGKAIKVGKAHPVKDASVHDGAGTAGTTPRGAALNEQLPQFWDWWQIGVDKAQAAGRTGTGQVVAVLDSGVDRNHKWLIGDVLREACYSSRTPGAVAGDCPNLKSAQTGTGAAAPCAWQGCAHGTHVSHTATGYYGVASGARLIAVQIFHYTATGPRTWESDYIRGLKFVYDLRATYAIAAVNLSIGAGKFTGYCDNKTQDGSTDPTYVTGWINALSAVNIATVAASGNDDYSNAVGYPACISGAISVGNTTLDAAGYDAVLGYTQGGSNSNATLDLLAPGTDICSAVPGNLYECHWFGTSMAAPHVAGAIAVLKQKRPGATVSQLLNALTNSGPTVYDQRNGISRIRINVNTALSKI